MNLPRNIFKEEKELVLALLKSKADTMHLIDSLDDLLVAEMDDGGMGSRTLIPQGLDDSSRRFGKEIVSGEFDDSDGILVTVGLYLDDQDRLYELDMWKVDFSPLLSWPDPAAIRIHAKDAKG